jgi:hypothetical protein
VQETRQKNPKNDRDRLIAAGICIACQRARALSWTILCLECNGAVAAADRRSMKGLTAESRGLFWT